MKFLFPAFLLVFLIGCDTASDSAGSDPAVEYAASPVVQKYLDATRDQQPKLRGMTMEVEIEASLPRLKKEGKMFGLRHISKVGQITYDALRFAGDNTIRKDVIARFLSQEKEASENQSESMAITPQNYKFKDKGLNQREGRIVHVFELRPRSKKVGLFKGELWLDPETYLPLRESGEFVKNPSMFLKKMEFIRDYEILDGVAVPRRIRSQIDTRLVGRAELNINYTNFLREDRQAQAIPAGDSQ